ncbi:MAG: AraC family ligand binding domain-containing protein, partial [Spirochaetia bacterium]|nr:AraC family ligand binding domain-containing protein [Spirochaetia bacterium]
MPGRKDPFFNLFELPSEDENHRRYLELGRARGLEQLSFPEKWMKPGIWASFHHQPETEKMVPHTHDFFEIAMALSGSSEHFTGETPFPFSCGEILFVNNQKRHHFRATSSDFHIANICFLPRVFGYPDSLPVEHQNLSLYSV